MSSVIQLGDKLVDPESGELIGEQQSIEGLAAEPHGAPIPGTEEQLNFDMGSEYQLNDSTLKIVAPPIMAVSGQFQEGDKIKVVLECEIEHLSFPPIKSRGFRVGTERRHTAQVISAAPLDE